MTVASFVFSAVALALSGAAFGWQILSWFMTGGRVHADLRIGARNSSGLVTTSASSLKPGWFEQIATQGYSAPIAAVQVHNRGRLPVYVNKWGVATTKIELNPIADSIGPDMPFKLEPGQEATWAVSLEPVLRLMDSRDIVGGSDVVHGFVVLGTGKKVKTRATVSQQQLHSGMT